MTEKWYTYMYTVVVRHGFGHVNIELIIVILFLADKTIEVVCILFLHLKGLHIYVYFFKRSKRSLIEK